MDIGYNVQVAQDTGDEISWQPLSLQHLDQVICYVGTVS